VRSAGDGAKLLDDHFLQHQTNYSRTYA
jgi:hypothetical protein